MLTAYILFFLKSTFRALYRKKQQYVIKKIVVNVLKTKQYNHLDPEK